CSVAFANVVETLLRFAGWIEVIVFRSINTQVGNAEIWVAFHVPARKVIMPEPTWIIVPEPIVPIVAPAAKLRRAFDGFDFTGVRPQGQVAAKANAAFGHLRIAKQRLVDRDIPAAFAIRGIKPAVHSPREAVETMLLVARVEAGGENFTKIGDTIAIRIFGVN